MEAIQEIHPYSDEWYACRLGKITSSEAFKITTEPTTKEKTAGEVLSEGAKTYLLECIAEILTGQPEEQGYVSNEMQWGIDNERDAMIEYSYKTLREPIMGIFIVENEYLCGTPDGVEINRVNDVKCPKSVNHIKNLMIKTLEDFKTAHKNYYWQLVCNAFIGKKEKATFISYDPRMKDEKLRLFYFDFDIPKQDRELIATKILHSIEFIKLTLKMLSDV